MEHEAGASQAALFAWVRDSAPAGRSRAGGNLCKELWACAGAIWGLRCSGLEGGCMVFPGTPARPAELQGPENPAGKNVCVVGSARAPRPEERLESVEADRQRSVGATCAPPAPIRGLGSAAPPKPDGEGGIL